MYRKASITGGGGVVYCQNIELYHRTLALADRGKPLWSDDYAPRDPSGYLFPALNLNGNELGCAIGIASLQRLPQTIERRRHYAARIAEELYHHANYCRPMIDWRNTAPFVLPIRCDLASFGISAKSFGKTLLAEGIELNPCYQYLACDWPWLQPYLVDDFPYEGAHCAGYKIFLIRNMRDMASAK